MVEVTDNRDKSGLNRSSEPLSGEKYSPKVSLSRPPFPSRGKDLGPYSQVLGS